jgi:3-dehydroquinate synthase
MSNGVILSTSLYEDLSKALAECSHDKIFVLTDNTTREKCWPLLDGFIGLRDAVHVTIPSGDSSKTLENVTHVWEALVEGGATRHSCMICLGGGMVTDLGGFAASTFKRGIDYVNIPTTLLSMVDASVGGKTGFNFHGLKNEVGVFADAQFVIINTNFLSTLDNDNLRSGYAEMLKHGLISNLDTWSELLSFDISRPELHQLQTMVGQSVTVKQHIVETDPREHGIRKALNLGHTIGHAIESWSIASGTPLLHGIAVAHGLVGELYLGSVLCDFPLDKLRSTVSFIHEHYGRPSITCDDYPTLVELMRHDKKNMSGSINFTLLGDVGDIRINQTAERELILEALDFIREG